MKLGKQPKRFGKPSAAFLARQARQAQKDDTGQIPQSGGIRIYLDDERKAPAGWTLVKSPKAFYDLIDNADLREQITHMSLDWHLGAGITNGEEVVKRLAVMLEDAAYFPKLEIITLHSSDRKKAIAMAKTLEAAIGRERETIVAIGRYVE